MIDEEKYGQEYQHFIDKCLKYDAAKRPDIDTLMRKFSFFSTAELLKDIWFEEYEQRMVQYLKRMNQF